MEYKHIAALTNLLNIDQGLVDEIRASQPTLRDRFAMAALQGLVAKLAVANPMSGESMIDGGTDGVGSLCWEIADAALRQREAGEGA